MLIGTAKYAFTTVQSTNQFAEELLSKTRPRHGTVIVTDFQTAGKGQNGRKWHGSPGLNVYVSIILLPILEASLLFYLNALFALSLREAIAKILQEHDAQVLIKWPNDIYVDQNKIAGILVQNSLIGKNIKHCVAGIGVNVNQSDFPEDVPNPTSLTRLTGKQYSVEDVTQQVISSANKWLVKHADLDDNGIFNEYAESLLGYNQTRNFRLEATGDRFSGTLRGIDANGRLSVERQGTIQHYLHGEIAMELNES